MNKTESESSNANAHIRATLEFWITPNPLRLSCNGPLVERCERALREDETAR